jgi:hypothetical protein
VGTIISDLVTPATTTPMEPFIASLQLLFFSKISF